MKKKPTLFDGPVNDSSLEFINDDMNKALDGEPVNSNSLEFNDDKKCNTQGAHQ